MATTLEWISINYWLNWRRSRRAHVFSFGCHNWINLHIQLLRFRCFNYTVRHVHICFTVRLITSKLWWRPAICHTFQQSFNHHKSMVSIQIFFYFHVVNRYSGFQMTQTKRLYNDSPIFEKMLKQRPFNMASYGTRLKSTSTSKTNLVIINHSYKYS